MYSRMIKAINTAAGLSAYCVVANVPIDPQLYSSSLSHLNDMGFTADVGFYQITKKKDTKRKQETITMIVLSIIIMYYSFIICS